MKFSTSLALSFAAGAACTAAAFADIEAPIPGSTITHDRVKLADGHRVGNREVAGAVIQDQPSSENRVAQIVSDDFTGLPQTPCFSGLGNTSHVVDDVDFAPRPRATTTRNQVDTFLVAITGGLAGSPAQVAVRTDFYDTVNDAAADMLAASTQLDGIDIAGFPKPAGAQAMRRSENSQNPLFGTKLPISRALWAVKTPVKATFGEKLVKSLARAPETDTFRSWGL